MSNATTGAPQQQLDAYNHRHIDDFIAAYAPECTVRAFPSGRVMLQGHEEMRARYGRLFAEHPDLHCHLLHRIAHEGLVIDHEQVTGLREGEVTYAVAMYEVRDGLIRNVWFARED